MGWSLLKFSHLQHLNQNPKNTKTQGKACLEQSLNKPAEPHGHLTREQGRQAGEEQARLAYCGHRLTRVPPAKPGHTSSIGTHSVHPALACLHQLAVSTRAHVHHPHSQGVQNANRSHGPQQKSRLSITFHS